MNKAVLAFALGLLFAHLPVAAKGPTGKEKAKSQTGSRLETDVKFDNSVVHGRYQMPDDATAAVENEKGLSDLLAVRKHFKDRLQDASGQE